MKRTMIAFMMLCSAAGLPAVGPAKAGAAHAQGKKKEMLPGQGIDWQGDWEAAVKEATARNVPIHFAVHKDN